MTHGLMSGGLAIWFGLAGLILSTWCGPDEGAAGKSYGPDTAMGIGMSDIGSGDSGPGAGSGGGGVATEAAVSCQSRGGSA